MILLGGQPKYKVYVAWFRVVWVEFCTPKVCKAQILLFPSGSNVFVLEPFFISPHPDNGLLTQIGVNLFKK